MNDNSLIRHYKLKIDRNANSFFDDINTILEDIQSIKSKPDYALNDWHNIKKTLMVDYTESEKLGDWEHANKTKNNLKIIEAIIMLLETTDNVEHGYSPDMTSTERIYRDTRNRL